MTKSRLVQGPFCFSQFSIRQSSVFFMIAFAPHLVMLWLTHSYVSLILIGETVCASLLAEFIAGRLKKKATLRDGTALVEGLVVGMFLPASYPFAQAFLVTFIALFAAKHLFGGLASSWASPAVVAVCAAFCLGFSFYPNFAIHAADAQSQPVYTALFQSGAVGTLERDAAITAFFNDFFQHLGISVPDGYVTLFWDSGSVIPAFRFNVLVLLVSIVFISTRIINWVIPCSCLALYMLLVRLFSLTPFTGFVGQGDVLVALLTGGTLFTVFFMLTWYGTAPYSLGGQLAYGFLSGGLLFLNTGYGTSPMGAVFTVLIVNIFSPAIQCAERRFYAFFAGLNRRKAENG